MKKKVTLRQITIPEEYKQRLLSRLDRFDKFFSADAVAELTLSEKREQRILELTISANGTLFRAEVENETFQSGLDDAVDIIERQIRRHKTKLQKQVKSGALNDLFLSAPEDEEDEGEAEFPIRVKSFEMRPMSVEEAILQMELIGHTFFVFRNVDSGGIEVVYEKKDGTYGLIVPIE